MKIYLSIVLISIFTITVAAQQPTENRNRGIEFYQKENFSEAAKSFQLAVKQNEADAEAWYYLGWTLLKTGNFKDSATAFKNAAKLKSLDARPYVGMAYAALSAGKPGDAQSKAEKAIVLDPKETQAYDILAAAHWRQGNFKSVRETADKALIIDPELIRFYQVKVSALFSEAIRETQTGTLSDNRRTRLFDDAKTVLESYPHLSANNPNALVIKNKIADLTLFQQSVEENLKSPTLGFTETAPGTLVDPSAFKILSKMRASYTDTARQNQEQGVVTVVVMFSADGTVPYALPLKGLKYGLTWEAVSAASHGISFKPAESNGKPVSVVKSIQYSFSIY